MSKNNSLDSVRKGFSQFMHRMTISLSSSFSVAVEDQLGKLSAMKEVVGSILAGGIYFRWMKCGNDNGKSPRVFRNSCKKGSKYVRNNGIAKNNVQQFFKV